MRPDFPPGTPLWLDPSFESLLAACPKLAALREWLPESVSLPFRLAGEGNAELQSSYRDHGYAAFLYALARALRPTVCVELGVYQGVSLLAVAAALRDNGSGKIVGFDLFEHYPYRHETLRNALDHVARSGLAAWAEIRQCDAFAAHEGFAQVDWLHVDLSNDGVLVRRVFEQWEPRVTRVMVFEGGAPARDRVAWMSAHGKAPIAPVVQALRERHPAWRFAVLAPYPSMTIAIRASECASR